MADGTRVTIDREGCISCGLCWATCPEFFEANNEDDRSQVVEEYQISGDPGLGLAPARLLDAIQEAAESCPVEVIRVG